MKKKLSDLINQFVEKRALHKRRKHEVYVEMKKKFLTWLCHFVNDFLAKRVPILQYRCQYDDTD